MCNSKSFPSDGIKEYMEELLKTYHSETFSVMKSIAGHRLTFLDIIELLKEDIQELNKMIEKYK